MDLTLRDILEHLYDEAYWVAIATPQTPSLAGSQWEINKSAEQREAAIHRAAELIEPLRDRAEVVWGSQIDLS